MSSVVLFSLTLVDKYSIQFVANVYHATDWLEMGSAAWAGHLHWLSNTGLESERNTTIWIPTTINTNTTPFFYTKISLRLNYCSCSINCWYVQSLRVRVTTHMSFVSQLGQTGSFQCCHGLWSLGLSEMSEDAPPPPLPPHQLFQQPCVSNRKERKHLQLSYSNTSVRFTHTAQTCWR